MKRFLIATVLIVTTVLMSACKKEEPSDGPAIPEGSEPYTEADIQFVPYTSGDRLFNRISPDEDSSFTLVFKERLRTEAYYAWDQTYFTYSNDATKEVELRLRYLQTEEKSQKTLAIYLPYHDAVGTLQQRLFEVPIGNPDSLEDGYFKDLVDFHDTLVVNSIEWYDVYEIEPLTPVDPTKDGPENYVRILYNKIYGIIEMDQNNGSKWVLEQ